MAKPNKDNIITEILLMLESGTGRKQCLSKIVSKWQISDRTFDRYWKSANEVHGENQIKIKEAISEISIETAKADFKGRILSKLERQAILTQIALGELPLVKYIVADGVIQEREVAPNYADRKAAIQELNKMDNAYADDINPDEELTEIVIKRINPNDTRT